MCAGKESVTVYRARLQNPDTGVEHESQCERSFCERCGSGLWAWDPRWPELVHPLASAIDSELPVPPERTHLMLGSKASWVVPDMGPDDKQFERYPEESIAEWHQRLEVES